MKTCLNTDNDLLIYALKIVSSIIIVKCLLCQDLNVNFRTIILPEALKIIQGQEPSVYKILTQLETILSECGMSLDTMISQLEVLHRNAVMGLKVTVVYLL